MSGTDVLYIDALAGASGDMFLGALVDLGVEFEALREGLQGLRVPGFDLRRHATFRHSIAATKVDVVVEDVPHPHRHLHDLLEIIERADLPREVKDDAGHVLELLADAEAHVHRRPVEEVHLHEVGGLDALVDVVGTCLGIHLLGVERIFSGPVSVGSAFIRCAHGIMPEPAPGTLKILEGFPIRRTQVPHEMTTPTGAALIAQLAQPVLRPLLMTPQAVGYGAGARDVEETANLLRLIRAVVPSQSLPRLEHDHDHDHHEHGHDHGHHHHNHHDAPKDLPAKAQETA